MRLSSSFNIIFRHESREAQHFSVVKPSALLPDFSLCTKYKKKKRVTDGEKKKNKKKEKVRYESNETFIANKMRRRLRYVRKTCTQHIYPACIKVTPGVKTDNSSLQGK